MHIIENCDQKWILNFVKCSFCIHWDNHMIFILSFIDVTYHTNCFVNIIPSLFSCYKFHLIMMCNLFKVLLNSVASMLLRIFAPIFNRNKKYWLINQYLSLSFSLSVASLSGFSIRVILASSNEFESISSSSNLGNILDRIGIHCSLNAW